MKTLVAVNVLDSVNAQVYGSHCQEWFRLGRNTSDEFILFHPNRYSIDNARNQAAAYALRNECDLLYFIDDDIILTPKTYQSLRDCIVKYNYHIAQALTFIRGFPFKPMMFTKRERVGEYIQLDYFDNYREQIDGRGLVECDAVGFSCVLIDCEVLKRINSPYFVTSSQTTEDVYFCLKLKDKLGSDVKFAVDTKIPTGHLLQPEALSVHNREQLFDYYQIYENPPNNKDRGKEYRERCLNQFNQLAK